jgi:hypothetical protein
MSRHDRAQRISLIPEYPTYKRHFRPRCACCRPDENVTLPPLRLPLYDYYIPKTPVLIDDPGCCYSCCGEVRYRRRPIIRRTRIIRFYDHCDCDCCH